MKIEQLSKPKKRLGKKSMLAKKRILLGGVAISVLLILMGCASKSTQSSGVESGAAVAGEPRESATQPVQMKKAPAQEEVVGGSLPVRFQKPSYVIKDKGLTGDIASIDEELSLQVGADITTTEGPVSLRDILKRLASLHNMNVSWASDVDQYVYIDVDISAEDDFFVALDNMLRQVDYFYEMKGN